MKEGDCHVDWHDDTSGTMVFKQRDALKQLRFYQINFVKCKDGYLTQAKFPDMFFENIGCILQQWQLPGHTKPPQPQRGPSTLLTTLQHSRHWVPQTLGKDNADQFDRCAVVLR
jgi:hypothetical protein